MNTQPRKIWKFLSKKYLFLKMEKHMFLELKYSISKLKFENSNLEFEIGNVIFQF